MALWLFATLFLRGDLGWWNDDYYFNQRDPATGQFARLITTTRDPFLPELGHLNPWRFLHLPGTAALVTLTWNHAWVAHAVGAAIHGLCTLLLFRLLRALGVSGHVAAAASLVHLVWATHYEVVLWPSAFSIGLGSAAFLGAALCMVRCARTGSVWAGLGAPLLTVVIVGFNEQPAGAIIALPLAYLAACPGTRGRVWRALWPAALCFIVVGAYVVNVRINGQPRAGSTPESYIAPSDAFRRVIDLARGVRDQAMLRHQFAPGAWRLALDEFSRRPFWTGLFAISLFLSLVPAWKRWMATPIAPPSQPSPTKARSLTVAAIGIAFLAGALLPILVIRGYPVNSRMFYLVSMALCVILAGISDLGASWLGRAGGSPTARRLSGAVLACLTLAGGILYVGAQSRWRGITQSDAAQLAKLRGLVPDPAPGTVFVPVVSDFQPIATGCHSFDRALLDVWRFSWSTPYHIKQVYGRSDVYQLYWLINGPREPWRELTPGAFAFEWRIDSPYPLRDDRAVLVPWDKVVPFVVGADGRISLITRWTTPASEAQPSLSVDVPQTTALARAGRIAPLECPFPHAPGAGWWFAGAPR
jgi:hypothetical protein